MMYTRRSPFRMFLMVGLGILLGAMLFGGAEVGGLAAAPFVVLGVFFKIALFFLIFGFIAKFFGGHGRPGGRSRHQGHSHEQWAEDARQWWQRSQGSRTDEDKTEAEADKFDEWHRMAHAKEEVDNHTPPVED